MVRRIEVAGQWQDFGQRHASSVVHHGGAAGPGKIGQVDGLVGAATETARLADLEVEVRDLLARLLDADDDDFELTWDMSAVLGGEGQAVWQAHQSERDNLAVLERRVEADRLATLRALHDAEVSLRDSAALVGLSHQRVAQLVSA